MAERRMTAKDVADKAHVSEASVNNWSSRPHLNSKELNERIERVAKEIGYSPGGRRRTPGRLRVGVEVHRTVEDISSGIYAPLLVALMDQVQSRGGRVVPFLTHDDPRERRDAYLEAWKGERVDGFIVDTVPPHGGEPLASLDTLDAPYVLFGRPPSKPNRRPRGRRQPPEYACVDVDNKDGMRTAVDHLVRHHHRNIVYLGPSPSVDHVSNDRWQGYEEAMRLAEAQPRRVDASYDEQLSTLAPRLEDLLGGGITAVAAFSDDLAVEFMRFASMRGIRIGGSMNAGEIAVVGYDDSEKARLGLTSVRQPVEQIGHHLVIALQERIRSRERPYQVILKGDLVVRDSSEPIAAPRTVLS